MVLPAPVSPVTAVNPGPSGRVASTDDAEVADGDLLDHAVPSWPSVRASGPASR